MTTIVELGDHAPEDPVSNILKWILLGVAVVCFAVLGWTTDLTYREAPQRPDRFVSPDGTQIMSSSDILAGKAGFQKADLMDYGSLYGMGSYFGEDYTAANLVRLAQLTEENIAKATTGKALAVLTAEERASVEAAMRVQLQSVDLTKDVASLSAALAAAIPSLRAEIAQSLLRHDFAKGWTQAHSLDQQTGAQTADFLIYSSLTTVARHPGTDSSWTQNWPFEPLVGNTPTTSTFRWTWISFCFAFFAYGRGAVHLRTLSKRSRPGPDGSGAGDVSGSHTQPAPDRQVFPGRRRHLAAANSGWVDHGALLRPDQLLRHRGRSLPAV
jgi:nitric oxide reductase subunit B